MRPKPVCDQATGCIRVQKVPGWVGLKVHLRTRQTGDAAVAVAELGPEGMFDAGKEYDWLRRSAAVEEL